MQSKIIKPTNFIDGNQICHLYRLNNTELFEALQKIKKKIDVQFQQFKDNLMNCVNNINFIRYIQNFPEDNIKFIFKQNMHSSTTEQRLNEKTQILQKMINFPIIKELNSTLSGNCIFQINQWLLNNKNILDFKKVCPSGSTFINRYEKLLMDYGPLWKNLKGQINLQHIFKDFSSAFPKQQMKKLGSIFAQTKLSIISSRLLFRGSEHNFQSTAFKQLCSDHGDTLLIAKSDKNKFFGAFTPCKWINTKEKQFVGDPTGTSFLFSLDKKLIFPIKKNQLDYAISAYGGWGPIYGSPYGPDLSISDKCNLNDHSCSSLGSHYQIPIEIKQYSNEAFSLLAGSKKFKVLEYQIYELILK